MAQVLQLKPPCACGCGKRVKEFGNKYLRYHEPSAPAVQAQRKHREKAEEKLILANQRIEYFARRSDEIILNTIREIIDEMVSRGIKP